MKKYCTRCGKPFDAIGREVICPSCKEHAAEDAKRAAVLKAKMASWTGESVPVRISGRASTVIRAYGKAHNLPFAPALDELLKASDYFVGTGKAWGDVVPYKSRRMKKSDVQDVQEVKTVQEASKPQDKPQDVQDAPVKPVKTAASTAKASKASASKAKASKASTASASKQ